jgi:hypothetical protein
MPVLNHNPLQRAVGRVGQNHVRKPGLRIRSGDKIGKFSDWPRDRHGRPGWWPTGLLLCLVNELSELLRQIRVASACGMSGDLHRDRQESLSIPLDVAP